MFFIFLIVKKPENMLLFITKKPGMYKEKKNNYHLKNQS
jgi:hypothetical protein